jgi:DNA-binding transcriptional regulator YiaG
MAKVNIPGRVEGGADNFSKRFGPKSKRPFSDEVKELRTSLGLTQEAFCKRYHIPLSNLRNWEQASKNVMPDTAARLLIDMIRIEPQRVAKIVEKAREAESASSFETA